MTQNLDYVQRLNRVVDHILAHLDEELQLEDLAGVACFSPFHFHRVFKSLTSETVAQFVKRVRLDRALFMMAHAPDTPLTEVALACGFSGSSDFSRAFKQRFGVPPSAFDVDVFMGDRRAKMQGALLPEPERHRLRRLPRGENPDGFVVELLQLPARSLAYLRVARPFDPDPDGQRGVMGASGRLVDWAEARGFADRTWYGYTWDDPDLVALERCRYDVAVEVDPAVPAEGEVGRIELPAMQVASLTLAGDIDLEQRALDWLWRTWLPEEGARRGLGPASQPCFEVWSGRPFQHGPEHLELSVHVPVEPLRPTS